MVTSLGGAKMCRLMPPPATVTMGLTGREGECADHNKSATSLLIPPLYHPTYKRPS